MVDLVVDTSAIIAVIANEPERAALIECTTGATLFAPASVHWEIGNAFAAMLKRRRITLDQARRAVAAYDQIPIRFLDVDLDKALAISDQFGIYAYDAYIIEAAIQQKCPILALDRGLAHAARGARIEVVEVGP
jgi:predicted nucleic acid-binding protein